MPKRLADGESKIIKPSKQFRMFNHDRFRVEAYREDCDSPYVRLSVDGKMLSMSDTETNDLIDRLRTALSILPTSK